MDTPELAQLYRRYQRYEHLAEQYHTVLDGLRSAEPVLDAAGGTISFHTRAFAHVPKSIPRGKPLSWYVEKHREYVAKARNTGDLYWSLKDAAKKRAWEALDRDGKLAHLREIGGRLAHITATIDEYRAKIPTWERELAEHGPITTAKDEVWAWMHHHRNPHAMVQTMTEALQQATEDRDWLLEHL